MGRQAKAPFPPAAQQRRGPHLQVKELAVAPVDGLGAAAGPRDADDVDLRGDRQASAPGSGLLGEDGRLKVRRGGPPSPAPALFLPQWTSDAALHLGLLGFQNLPGAHYPPRARCHDRTKRRRRVLGLGTPGEHGV